MHEISNLFPFNYRQALFSFDLIVKDGGGMPLSIAALCDRNCHSRTHVPNHCRSGQIRISNLSTQC